MTTLLALDTSTEACSVALWHQGERTHLDELAQRTHTQRILPMLDQLLVQSGLQLKQVDALVFGRGPGSFTGVRVSAGIAQGLALGTDLPVIPVSTLTAMAQQAYEQFGASQILAAIDARMNEVYFSQLQGEKQESGMNWHHIIEEQVVSPEKVIAQLQAVNPSWLQVGTGWAAYTALQKAHLGQPSNIVLPSAQYMLPIGLALWTQKKVISAVEIEPVYLRNEVTWKKLPGRS